MHSGTSELSDEIFQGDIILTEEQKEELEGAVIEDDATEETEETQNNAKINPRYLWPQGVLRYEFSPQMKPDEKAMIRNTLKNLTSKLDSCIQFVESSSGNRIYIRYPVYCFHF